MEAEKALERITPEEAGISSRQVKKCIEELMHETTQMHGFMAVRYLRNVGGLLLILKWYIAIILLEKVILQQQ
jgi:hypothetical protein